MHSSNPHLWIHVALFPHPFMKSHRPKAWLHPGGFFPHAMVHRQNMCSLAISFPLFDWSIMVNLCPHVPKAVKICGLSREISPRFPQVKGVEPHHALSVLKASPDDAASVFSWVHICHMASWEIPKRFQEVDKGENLSTSSSYWWMCLGADDLRYTHGKIYSSPWDIGISGSPIFRLTH